MKGKCQLGERTVLCRQFVAVSMKRRPYQRDSHFNKVGSSLLILFFEYLSQRTPWLNWWLVRAIYVVDGRFLLTFLEGEGEQCAYM